MATVEAGIRAREDARILLVEAQACWRSRCARHLIDGVADNDSIAADLRTNEQIRARLAVDLAAEHGELRRLTDDQEFQRSYRDRTTRYNDLKAQLDALERSHSQTIGQIETLMGQQRVLQEKAEAADGLTVDQAHVARRAAGTSLGGAQRAKGVTDDPSDCSSDGAQIGRTWGGRRGREDPSVAGG